MILKQTPLQKRLVQERIQKMPTISYFASNHIMINRDRVKCGIKELKRSASLDELARNHASSISEEDINHEYANEGRIFAQNIGSGPNIEKIHKKLLKSKEARSNLLDERFKLFGTGSCRRDGQLFLCQVFST